MYGWRLRLLCESIIAFLLGTYLTFKTRLATGSWSESALNDLQYVLNGMLIPISWAFIRFGELHPSRKVEFYKFFKWEIRLMHLALNTGWSFGAIAVFHLGNVDFSDGWHFAATGSGVIWLALLVTGFFKMWTKFWHVFTWPILGSGLWLAASFIWDVSPVKYPEYSLMIIGLIFLLFTMNKKAVDS